MPSRSTVGNAPLSAARESNAGDDFHILWAARRALDLLDPTQGLTGLSIEGPDPEEAANLDPTGEHLLAIDVAEYYGSLDFRDATQVHFCQLKYSTRNPQEAWTAARLATGRNGDSNRSPIARLAQSFLRYREAYGASGVADKLLLRLISNQPVSRTLATALADARNILGSSKPPRRAQDLIKKLDQDSQKEIQRLREASALRSSDFVALIAALDLGGCGAGSRDLLRTKLIVELETLGLSVSERGDLAKLKEAIHQRMMPEASAHPPLDRHSLLPVFGIANYEKLFPCPPELPDDSQLIDRPYSRLLAETIKNSAKPVLLHATGGIGKTTVLSNVGGFLPDGSIHLSFDCYGGGSYMNPADTRHTHHRALIQLANELAQKCGTPFLLPNSAVTVADLLRDLLMRLSSAAAALKRVNPEAIVLITIDAADNSLHAAQGKSEASFVPDLLRQPMLPGVKLALSCRTEHRHLLPLDVRFDEIEIPPFTLDESRTHLRLYLNGATDTECSDFHTLTNGIPRVQKYLLGRSFATFDDLLKPVRPDGKGLDDLFEAWLQEASRRSGLSSNLDRLSAILINLPRPIPVRLVEVVAGESSGIVRSFCIDVGRGLVVRGEEISFRDQDFEDFLRRRAAPKSKEVIQEAATRLLGVRKQEPYAARHVHLFLERSGGSQELLNLVHEEGNEIPLLDPVEAASVLFERVKSALRTVNASGSQVATLRLLLVAAEAKKRDLAVRKLILENPGLAIQHNGPENLRNLCEQFEVDDEWPAPDHWHKARLFSLLPETRDRAVRHLEEAGGWIRWWSSQPKQEERNTPHWHRIEDEHLADAVEAILRVDGLDAAYHWLSKWTPKEMYARVVRRAVLTILDEEGSSYVLDVIGQRRWSADLSLYLFSALGERNVSMKSEHLHRLTATWCRFVRSKEVPHGLRLLLLRVCEQSVGMGTEAGRSVAALTPHLELGAPSYPSLGRHDGGNPWVPHLRWLTLRELLDNTPIHLDQWLPAASTPLSPDAKPDERSKHRAAEEKRKEWESTYRILLPAFRLRVRVLAGQQAGEIESKELIGAIQPPFEHYQDSRRRDAHEMREVLLGLAADVISASGARAVNHAKALLGMLRIWPFGWTTGYLLLFAERLKPTAGLAEVILEVITEVAKILASPNFSGTEKVDHFLRMASITRRFHREAASEYFRMAIRAAEDVDQEAPYRLRALSRIGTIASSSMESYAPAACYSLARFAEQSYSALGEPDHWPWEELLDGVASMDPPSLPAILTRWDDRGFRELERHYSEAAEALMNRGFWKASDVLCLAVIDFPVYALKPMLVTMGKSEKPLLQSALTMLERDILVDLEPEAREQSARIVCEWAEESDYRNHPSVTELGKYLAFCESIGSTSVKQSTRQPIDGQESGSLDERVQAFDLPSGQVTVQILSEFLAYVNDLDANRRYVRMEALRLLRSRVSLAARSSFLDALLDLSATVAYPDLDALDLLEDCKNRWATDPLVLAWFRRADIAVRFIPLQSFRYFSRGRWIRIIGLLELPPAEGVRMALPALIARLESNSAEDLYQIVEAFASALSPGEAAEVMRLELPRLEPRLHHDSADGPWDPSMRPQEDSTDSLASFLWKILGHPDKRLRWRGAHVVRRLARIGNTAVLARLVSRWEAQQLPAYSDKKHPFFWLSARTWLLMALDRIAAETPEAVKPHAKFLYDQAVGCDPPHALQRFYAKRACMKLRESTPACFTRKQLQLLRKSCVSPYPRKRRSDKLKFSNPKIRNLKHDYRFDETDTVPHWFSDLTELFSVPMGEVKSRAAQWICERWHFTESQVWNQKTESRRHADWNMSSHSHGSEPTIERLVRYLDWHAMMCAATDLLSAIPLTKSDWDDESANGFEEFLKPWTPHFPDLWLADLIQPVPHEPLLHSFPAYPPDGWARDIPWSRFDEYLRSCESTWPAFFTVSGHFWAGGHSCRETVGITSALVYHNVGQALMAALQTCPNTHAYNLPDQGEEWVEVSDTPFLLNGWLGQHKAPGGYTDDKDPFRRSTEGNLPALGSDFLNYAGAQLSDDRFEYLDGNDSQVAVRQVWDDSQHGDGRSRHEPARSGVRLLVKTDKLLEYLGSKGCCLVLECTIDRYRERNEDKDAPRKAKIYLLHPNGQLESLPTDPLAGNADRDGPPDGP